MFDQNNNINYKNLQNILSKRIIGEAMNAPMTPQQKDALLSMIMGKNKSQPSAGSTTQPSAGSTTQSQSSTSAGNPYKPNSYRPFTPVNPIRPRPGEFKESTPAELEQMKKLKDELKKVYTEYKSKNPSIPRYM